MHSKKIGISMHNKSDGTNNGKRRKVHECSKNYFHYKGEPFYKQIYKVFNQSAACLYVKISVKMEACFWSE